MRREVIQDSDDDGDDDGFSPSPPPHSLAAKPDATSVSGVSTATDLDSTDPAFIQSILDEQFGDTRPSPSGPVSISSYAHELVTTLEAETSGPSSDVVTIVKPNKAERISLNRGPSRKSGALISMKSRTEKQYAAADIWEIPSSLEEGPDAEDLSHRGRRSIGQPTSCEPLDETPYSNDTRPGSRKRRKVNHPAFSQGKDDVDPISAPHYDEHDDAANKRMQESMLPPTQPILGKSSFLMVSKGTPTSQREAYTSFPPQSSEQISQDKGPTYGRNEPPIILSSGSATNVNTPRSELLGPCSLNMGRITQDDLVQTQVRQSHLEGNLSSSVDEFAMPAPILKQNTPTKKQQKKKRDLRLLVEPDDEDQGDELNMDTVLTAAEGEDEDHDYLEATEKPKKPRGRPKRKKDTDIQGSAIEKSKPVTKDNEEAPGPKKKRGRPRKAAAEAPEATYFAPVIPNAQPLETPGVPGTPRPTDLNEKDAVLPIHGDGNRAAIARLEEQEVEKKHGPMSLQHDEDESDDVAKTAPAPYEEPQTAKRKEDELEGRMSVGKAGSWNSVKPLHRVGLSKKLKIAPLLKSVRK